jgi:hypothetical protein
MLIGIHYLGYFVEREDFNLMLPLFFGLFLCLLLFKFWFKEFSWSWIFVGGLVLRLSLLMAIPFWSEDFVRFLWDGELVRMGFNPYLELPADFLQTLGDAQNPYLANLLDLMNSPNYFSVYPPLNQGIFYLAALGAEMDPWQGVVALRILIILGEIGVFFVLKKLFQAFSIPSSQLILYWLNPLVILELTGNLHFEGFVLLSLLLVVYLLSQSRFAGAGFFWGIAIGIKLLPLMLIPALIAFAKTRKSIGFWIASFVAILVSFAWLLLGDSWMNFFQSLRLYQGKFEFNASIYYLLREVGFWIKGYNTIATLSKILSGITLISILYFSWKRKPESIPQLVDLWVLIYLIYLVLQPVVHPWYIIPAFGLSLMSNRRTFLIWTFATIFSYQAYGTIGFEESALFLILEYGLLSGVIFSDYFLRKRNSNLQL